MLNSTTEKIGNFPAGAHIHFWPSSESNEGMVKSGCLSCKESVHTQTTKWKTWCQAPLENSQDPTSIKLPEKHQQQTKQTTKP